MNESMTEPFPADVIQRQVEHLEHSIVGWKRAPGLGDFRQAQFDRLTGVRRPKTAVSNDLVNVSHMRWRIERDYQGLLQNLRLEGWGWLGFDHQATLSIAEYVFLVEQPLKPCSDASGNKLRQTPSVCRSQEFHSSGEPNAYIVTWLTLNNDATPSVERHPYNRSGALPAMRFSKSGTMHMAHQEPIRK